MKIKYLIFGGLIISMLSSCDKDKLSPIPQASLSDAVSFSTPDRIAQQVNGIYSAMKSGQFLGGRTLVYNDVRGEDWLNVTGNGVTALGVWNYSVVSTDNQVENFWSAAYAAINRANVVIEGISANPSVIPTATAQQYIAQAKFCRAMCNFYLVTTYGRKPYNADAGASPGIPLRKTAAKGSGGEHLARSTVAETMTYILQDLNDAEANLPLKYSTGDSNVVFAHRNAAIAMKTRVYLHMNRYSDVVAEANKIVSTSAPFAAATGVAHTLNSNFVNVFRSSYTALESIFSMPMTNVSAPGTQNGLALYHNAEFSLNSAGILANTGWTAADARKSLVTGTLRYTKFNDDNNNYVPIIRYAEVMLNLAEALARQNTGVDARAVALLNAVRKRSDAAVTLAPTTQAELIDMILTERRIELLGEGFRSLDIQRLVVAYPAKGTLTSVPSSALNYVWPIPASELLYNNLMTPNQ